MAIFTTIKYIESLFLNFNFLEKKKNRLLSTLKYITYGTETYGIIFRVEVDFDIGPKVSEMGAYEWI